MYLQIMIIKLLELTKKKKSKNFSTIIHLNVQRKFKIITDLGELACFYDRDYIDLINNKDIDEFLDIYNELTQEPLQVDRIVVNDEVEEQDFIEYINNIENGFQKYKDNSYSIPTTKIIVKKTYREMPDLETITIEDEKTEENIEEILCFF